LKKKRENMFEALHMKKRRQKTFRRATALEREEILCQYEELHAQGACSL
jgi:hypothetical protein